MLNSVVVWAAFAQPFCNLSGRLKLTLTMQKTFKGYSSAPLTVASTPRKWVGRSFALLILCASITTPASVFAKKSVKNESPNIGNGSWKAAVIEGNRRLERKELEPAEICFREALKDARRDKSASGDDEVVCLEHLASTLQSEDQTEEALRLYKKALKIIQKEHGKDSEATVPTRTVIGDINAMEADYHEAAIGYGDALVILSSDSNLHAQRIADLRHRLGYVVSKAGDNALATKFYKESLDSLMQQQKLTSSALVETVLDDYCNITYNLLGRRLSSAFQNELLKDNVGTGGRTKNVQDSHWTQTVSARFSSAANIGAGSKAGNPANAATIVSLRDASAEAVTAASAPSAPADAVPQETHLPPMTLDRPSADTVTLAKINAQRADFYKRMIAIDINTLGAEHPSVARDLSGLAHVYLSQNNYEEAKILLQRALKIYRGTYSSNPQLVKRTELMLTLIDRKQNPPSSAMEPFKDYSATLPRIPLETQNLETALRLNYLGLMLYSEGRVEEAEKVYSWALASTSGACGTQSTMAGSCLVDYAMVLKSGAHKTLADQYDASAEQIFSAALAKQTASMLP